MRQSIPPAPSLPPARATEWLICQGQEKIEEGCKGTFAILRMHFFIAYLIWAQLELTDA